MGFIDAYTIQARLFPAILGIAPAIALSTIAVTWNTFSLPQAITTTAVAVLFAGFSDIARRFGKRAERALFRGVGGRPTMTLLCHSSSTFDDKTKKRYRDFLGSMLAESPPTAEDERDTPELANGFYERCGIWLRERTRNTARFRILFEENKTYGFRRNLYGVKWPALTLNAAVILTCMLIILRKVSFPNDPTLTQVFTVLVIAAIHAFYFLFFVSRNAVIEASDQYVRQLVLCCETLMQDGQEPKTLPQR